ncbi:ribitol kinase [Ephemerocybe angulata]|uniref:Ribitol kinase n=1 Tax=Ephemerocybe angulata TaxID=980116 RepID=A0A8H6IBE5_9AGAR|nr:ribitol kinase [Tulosesus angulatus]
MSNSDPLYIGVDIGTGSARAALSRADGTLLYASSYEIRTWRSDTDHRVFEQSTSDIWGRICAAVKDCVKGAAGANSESDIASRVHGIGFDATCSLASIAVTDGSGLGVVGERNLEKEAEEINATGSTVLDYVGGNDEQLINGMEIPKILWLKRHMKPELATGSTARSCCSLTCKCSYVSVIPKPTRDGTSGTGGWDDKFFHTIGLGELVERGYGQIGATNGVNAEKVLTAGIPVGRGLSKKAAEELGLLEGTPVGSGLSMRVLELNWDVDDSYAGWLGTVGARCLVGGGSELEAHPSVEESGHRLAVVAGTSTCHIVQNPVFPGWWMNEGGQSATGQLIEHMISTHPAKDALYKKAKEEGKNIYTVLHDTLERLRVEQKVASYTELTKDLHIYPDFHGNRSPIADPRMRGSIIGLTLDRSSLSSLALLYHATLTAIALQTRSIVDTLNGKGHSIKRLYVSGSQAQNSILMQLLADACYTGEAGAGGNGLEGVVKRDVGGEGRRDKRVGVSAVVLGAAMLGRMAHVLRLRVMRWKAEILWDIMTEMTPPGVLVPPATAGSGEVSLEKKILDAKYEIFLETVEIQKRWRDKMDRLTRE